jgi:hypothetical protein
MKQTAVDYLEEMLKIILYVMDEDEFERIQEVIDEAKKIEAGAKWQQEQDKKMYSEEEMLKMLHKFGFDYTYNYKGEKTIYEWIPEWFEEYKRLEQLNK